MIGFARSALLCSLAWLAGCQSSSPPLTHGQENIEAACTRLVMAYALLRDQGAAASLAELFTADAVLILNGETFVGRDALIARAQPTASSPYLTHFMGTVQIYADSNKTARGISYVSVYVGPADGAARSEAKLAAIGEYRDQFTKTAQGWKIARREFVPRIAFPNSTSP